MSMSLFLFMIMKHFISISIFPPVFKKLIPSMVFLDMPINLFIMTLIISAEIILSKTVLITNNTHDFILATLVLCFVM